MVKFAPLDQSSEDSIGDVLLQIDLAIQYGEDLEPDDPVSVYTEYVSQSNVFSPNVYWM